MSTHRSRWNLTLAYAAMALSFLFLASCGSDEKEALQFWHFQSEPNQKKALDSLLSDFSRETGIKVETTELSWSDGKSKLIAAFNSSTGPDILEIGSDWIAQFAAEDIFVPVTDSILDTKAFFPYALEAAEVRGNVYAIPWYLDSRPVMINKKLLADFGVELSDSLSWSGLASTTHPQIKDKFLLGINGPDRHRLYKKLLPMIWSNSAKIKVTDSYHFDSKELIEAVEIYKELSKNALVETQKNLDVEFLKGNIAILNSGSWLLDRMIETSLPFEVVPYLPIHSGGKGIAFAGGEYLAISTQSRKTDQAISLMRFLTEGENVVRFAQMVPEAGFPARSTHYMDQRLFERQWKDVFARQLESSRMTPSDNRWLDVEEILEEEVEYILYDKKTASQAMKDAQRRVEKLKHTD